MASLAGKVITITGAASGMGRAAAILFAQRGASLALSDVDLAGLEGTKGLVLKNSDIGEKKITTTRVDVRNRTDVDNWINDTVKRLGKLNGAANIAGGMGPQFANVSEIDDDNFKFVMDINLTGSMFLMRAQLRNFSPSGGSLVNVSSGAGLRGSPKFGPYCASKWGLIGLTKSAAIEVGSQNIRVNVIAPGIIRTPLAERLGVLRNLDRIPLQRAGEPEEIAKLIGFLLSDDASYITGSTYEINGGELQAFSQDESAAS